MLVGPANANVSAVTVSADSYATGNTGASWTFTFTSGLALDGSTGGEVVIVFPAGFDVSGAQATFGSEFAGVCFPSPTIVTGQQVEAVLPAGCSLGATTSATVTLTGLSPGVGTYLANTFTVATDQDPTAVAATGSAITIATPLVSSVTFSGLSQQASSTTDWTVGFTPSSTGGLHGGGFDYVSVTFPAGFTVPSPTVSLTFGTGFSCVNTSIGLVGGQGVEVDLPTGCNLAASTPATIVLHGITNPSSAGNFSGALVSTSADITDVAPASPIAISPATAVSTVSFSGSSNVANATGTTWTVGFRSSSSGSLATGNTITATFDNAFTIPATPTVTFATGFTGCPGTTTGSTTGHVVTITLSGTCALGVSTNATVTIAGITNPAAAAYTNTHFSVATSKDTSATSPASSITITAPLFTVTFDANGGSGSMGAQTFTGGVAQALTANAFTFAGHSFTGWNTVTNGSGTAYSDGQSITISGNVTLYAQWSVPTYTVLFDPNGGSGSIGAETYTSGVAKALTANAFTFAGHTFTGWTTAADGGGTHYSDGQSITISSSVILYAQWAVITRNHGRPRRQRLVH